MKSTFDKGRDTANLVENIHLNGKLFSAHEQSATSHSTLRIPLGSFFLKGLVSVLMGLPRRIFSDQPIDMSDTLDLKIK